MTWTREQMLAIGGSPWQKNGKDRIYLNGWADLIGLAVTRYGTGNISSATLGGEPISNGKARQLLGQDAKVWWDAADGQIHITAGTVLADRYAGDLHDGIAAAVERAGVATPPAEPEPQPEPTVKTPAAPVPDGHVRLTMPNMSGTHLVNLSSLTPKAAALAEALAGTEVRWIAIESIRPARDVYGPKAEFMFGVDSPRLDQPVRDAWEGWRTSVPQIWTVGQALEYEAAKMPGWVPVGRDGDVPHSAAARDADALTPDQCVDLLRQLGSPAARGGKEHWMSVAPEGRDGYPKPADSNGFTLLWRAADVRALAERVSAC
jgi:hypothetical protein